MTLLVPAPPAPPPGWYADPWRVAALRWWNGTAWTGDVHGHADYAVRVTTPPRPDPRTQRPSVVEGGEARVRPGLAIAFAGVCITAGLIYQVLVYGLDRGASTSSGDYLLRRDLVIGLAFYVIVGAGLALFVRTQKVRLVWHRGSPRTSALVGAVCGLSAGFVIVAANSGLSGHTTSDPRVEMLVSEGGFIRIALAFVLTSVLAPLVEETLFRGVVAGSLVGRSTALAVVASAIAFAVWHLNITSLRYYAVMGAVIALIWLKRGLIASMTAHACFNGLLTVVAVVVTQTGGTTVHLGALDVRMPAGWRAVLHGNGQAGFEGPSASSLFVERIPLDQRLRDYDVTTLADEVVRNLGSGVIGAAIDPGSGRTISTGAGEGVELDVHTARGAGHIVLLRAGDDLYEIDVRTQGSPRADSDFTRILRDLTHG